MAFNDTMQSDMFFDADSSVDKKKRKIDKEALSSSLMHIPRMDIQLVRDLIDTGIREIYQLEGRSAESLFEDIAKLRPNTPAYRLAYLRMAVYFSENDPPDASKLHPKFWQD